MSSPSPPPRTMEVMEEAEEETLSPPRVLGPSSWMNSGNLATASATIILLTTGLLINRNPSAGETVTLGKDLDCLDGRPFHSRAFMDLMQLTAGASGNKTMPVPQALIVAASVILPLSPLLLNSKTTFNEGKWNALLAHALGQTASFGSTEIARHFVVAPDWRFFPSCNLSLSDCQQLAPGPYRLARDLREFENDTENWVAFDDDDDASWPPPRTAILCPQPAGRVKDLFNSLHSMPDVVSALVGASTVMFASNLWFWRLSNRRRKRVASSHDMTKIALIAVFLLYVTLSMFYRFRYVENSFGELLMSFIYGAGIQCFISMLYQNK
jgi:RsiW-degrading membrane proteinase PrsW (M82 family)